MAGMGDDEWKPATTGHDAGYLLPRLEPETFRTRNAITTHDMADNNELPFFFSFFLYLYRGADKSLARPTSRCILFDGENISFGASLLIYI